MSVVAKPVPMTMENILLIRFKSIGDVILTLPAVQAIRNNFPAAKITFLISKEHAGLLRGFREVNEVITLDRAALRSGNPLRVIPEFVGLLRRLRSGKFDLVVDFQGYGETAWITRFTGAPNRWGIVYSKGRAWAYTRGVTRQEAGVSQIADFNLAILKLNGLSIYPVSNQFCLPADSLMAARNFFAEQKLEASRPTLFIQAFTSSHHKNWPLEKYLAVAEHFRAGGVQVIFCGGPRDLEALRSVERAGYIIAAGFPLLTAAGIMQLSNVIIGGVTGLVHLAVAMQKRVVMLLDVPANEPGLPYQHQDWIVAPDEHTGLYDLKSEKVIAACRQAFNELGGNVSC